MAGWDYRADGDSVAATLFIAWTTQIPRAFLEGELDGPVLANYLGWSSYVHRFLRDTLEGRLPFEGNLSERITQSLAQALDDVESRLGTEVDSWRWDRLHHAVFPHYPLHTVPPLRRWFSRSSPRGGDWSTVNLGTVVASMPYTQRNIPGYRQVIDLSQPDGGRFLHAMGQSGHFLSPRYDEYLADWAAGNLRPMRMEPTSIEAALATRLELLPATP
jgi:penicillin amidase